MSWFTEILNIKLEQLLIKYCVIKHLILLKTRNMMDINVSFKFFDKKPSVSGIKNENISDQRLAEKFHKPVIRKFEKRKVHPPFIGDVLGADLPHMQLISKFNKGFRFLLCVIDIYSKYAWVIPLKKKKRYYNY